MNELEQFSSKGYISSRQFSTICFDLMYLFHWTYYEVMEIPIPVFYSLMEYLNKLEQNKK